MIELKRIRSKIKICCAGFLTTLLIIFGLYYRISEEYLAFLDANIYILAIVALIVELVCVCSYVSKLESQYRAEFRNRFVKKELERTFNNLCYDPKKGILSSVIKETGMINMGNTYESRNYISGEYKTIRFEQADVHISDEYVHFNRNGIKMDNKEYVFDTTLCDILPHLQLKFFS